MCTQYLYHIHPPTPFPHLLPPPTGTNLTGSTYSALLMKCIFKSSQLIIDRMLYYKSEASIFHSIY
jgi:hypothetical protein